jgi:hypothetical protein
MPRRQKLTDEQKRWRRHQRRAAKENAKTKEEIPLFADQVPERTATDEYWRWRHNVACAAEWGGQCGTTGLAGALGKFTEYWLKRLASAHVSAEMLEQLQAFRVRCYPDGHDDGVSFWMGVLCGQRVVTGYRVAFDPAKITQWNKDGRYRIEEGILQLSPAPWTKQALWEFMEQGREKPPPVPDNGLAEKVAEVLGKRPIVNAYIGQVQ